MQALIETIEKSNMFLDLLLNGILPRQEITELENDTLSLKCIILIYISKITKFSLVMLYLRDTFQEDSKNRKFNQHLTVWQCRDTKEDNIF